MVAKKYKTIHVEEEIKELIQQCREEFLKHHPEMEGVKLTDSKVLMEVCKWYLS